MRAISLSLVASLVFWGCATKTPTPDPALAPPVLYDKDWGNVAIKSLKDHVAGKPPPPINAYYLAQPSGPFTKEEIFGLCSTIGFSITNVILQREKNETPYRVLLEIFPYNDSFKGVQQRDVQLAQRVHDYHIAAFEAASALSPDEAKQRQSGFPEGRQFVEFARSNIMRCYATLGSW